MTKTTKVLTGARGRVAAAKTAAKEATLVERLLNKPFTDARNAKATKAATKLPAIDVDGKGRITLAKGAKAPAATAKPAKAAKAATPAPKPAPTPRGFQAAMVKLLVSRKGATRPEMQAAAGSKTMPNAFFLNRMADRFGYECYADKASRADVLVYQFVRPGEKPTAYD